MANELTERIVDAFVLAQLLPDYVVKPDLRVGEDSGDIEFEWYADKHNVCVMWMRDRVVSYAGMADSKSLSGRTGEKAVIPAPCMCLLLSVSDKLRQASEVQTTTDDGA